MIPQDTVRKILETAQIEEVIGDFVTLKRRGADFVACCPFHNEKTPSFYVHPSKGFYYCFGCHKSGSAIGFVMDYEHLSYTEALKYLAGKYNIEIVEEEETAEAIAERQRSESLMLVTDFAQKFFVESLNSEEGRSIGYQYFKSRHLEDSTIEKYGLGWAPRSRKALAEKAISSGYKEEYLEETGLCVKYEDGSLKDSFYDRVTFPIHSVSGRVIGFGARTLSSDHTIAKYKNSKESPIYIKNQSLYGIWFAKNEIAKQDKCYLVEGYLDVLSMHQLGITNVVASSGTALTPGQIKLIRRFTRNVVIMYDGDSAGIHAALRGIDMFLQEGMNVKIVLIPDGDDPDSYSRKHTLAEVKDFLSENEKDCITFKSEYLMEGAGKDPLKRAEVINQIADTIAAIPDPVKRAMYVQNCSEGFQIDSAILYERIKTTRETAANEAYKAAQREKRIKEANLPPEQEIPQEGEQSPQTPDSPEVTELEKLENNKLVGKEERDLINFIITNGTDDMKFESDSEFYQGEGEDQVQTVFDFIEAALDGQPFLNEIYKNVYDAYADLYYEGYSQDDIIKALMDSPDRTTAFVTGQLCSPKYELTVKNFSDALMSTDSWLVKYVPKAILVYHVSRLEDKIASLKQDLASADEQRQEDILKDIIKLQQAVKIIKIKLGREKSNN